MSIADYVLEEGVKVVGKGKGWSVWHEPATNRWRFDVFVGEDCKCVPLTAPEMTRIRAATASRRLWDGAYENPKLAIPARALKAFVDLTWPA